MLVSSRAIQSISSSEPTVDTLGASSRGDSIGSSEPTIIELTMVSRLYATLVDVDKGFQRDAFQQDAFQVGAMFQRSPSNISIKGVLSLSPSSSDRMIGITIIGTERDIQAPSSGARSKNSLQAGGRSIITPQTTER